MARTVKEWRGKTDDSRAPASVRQRIYDKADGICYLCSLPIKPGETWDADHKIALINGGENSESNLAPVHKHCHVSKSALDVKEKSKVAAIRQKHTGAKRPKQTIKSAGFPKEDKPRKELAPLPRRQLYKEVGA